MQGRTRVFVSGPYSHGDVETNVRTAIQAADTLLEAGFLPFLPHLSHYWEQVSQKPYETWMEIDFGWLAQCQAVLRLPGHSPGADRECDLAKQLGIPVVTRIEDLRCLPRF